MPNENYQVTLSRADIDAIDSALAEYGDCKTPTPEELQQAIAGLKEKLESLKSAPLPQEVKDQIIADNSPEKIEREATAAWREARTTALRRNAVVAVLRERLSEVLANPQEFSVQEVSLN
jgi:hypothetical protein